MPTVTGIALIVLATFVLTRGQGLVYNRVFFLLYLASGLKSLGEAALFAHLHHGLFGNVTTTLVALATRLLAYAFVHIFLWFVLVFPRPVRPSFRSGTHGAWLLLLALPFALDDVTGLLGGISHPAFFNVYGSILGLAALGLLVYHGWETDSHEERHRLRLLSITFYLVVLSSIVITTLTSTAAHFDRIGDPTAAALNTEAAILFTLVLAPVLEFAGCFLLLYAILHYQLLGIEVIARRVTKGAVVTFLVGALFVIVSNSVEQLVQVQALEGVPLDFIVAGFIATVALYPVQRLTERLVNRVFPRQEADAPNYVARRRLEIYEAQVRYALLDGSLREKELLMLRQLRDSLDLTPAEIQTVARRFPGLDAGSLLPRAQPTV